MHFFFYIYIRYIHTYSTCIQSNALFCQTASYLLFFSSFLAASLFLVVWSLPLRSSKPSLHLLHCLVNQLLLRGKGAHTGEDKPRSLCPSLLLPLSIGLTQPDSEMVECHSLDAIMAEDLLVCILCSLPSSQWDFLGAWVFSVLTKVKPACATMQCLTPPKTLNLAGALCADLTEIWWEVTHCKRDESLQI